MESVSEKKWKKIKAPTQREFRSNRNWIEDVLPKILIKAPKPIINLTAGDPTLYPAFHPSNDCIEILSDSVDELNGYLPKGGYPKSREYLAKWYSDDYWKLSADDVFFTGGCNGALAWINYTLANPGDTILLPQIQFPAMNMICYQRGINVELFKLNPEKNWEVDLEDLEEKLKKKPEFIYFIHPSNPIGVVYSDEHIKELLRLTDKYKVPIVTDEVYETMVFNGAKFSSFGRLSRGQPVFVCSAYSKTGLAPGWRMGWIVCYGKPEIMAPVKKALTKTSPFEVRHNSLGKTQLPSLFEAALKHMSTRTKEIDSRVFAYMESLKDCPAVNVFNTSGPMFAVFTVDFKALRDIKNSREFTLKLLEEEEGVNTLPGILFGEDTFIRVLILSDEESYKEFGIRTKRFIQRHLA